MSVKIALAGNPNCGKTTLFNALTGSNQFVGNWPGVTVEKKEGRWKGREDVIIVDLPGIYSLSPYSMEEVIARDYLMTEQPDVIINIVDGTNLERNLYLSTQIMELGFPVILAVNMMDLLEKTGDKIYINKLSDAFHCEAIEISALKGTGIEEAVKKAVELSRHKKNEGAAILFNPVVEAAIRSAEEKLDKEIPEEQKRFFAIKLLEKDPKISGRMNKVPDVSDEIGLLERELEDDTESIIINERYEFITSVMETCSAKRKKIGLTVSDKIDRVVTNRWLALPIFGAVMFFIYYIAVTTVGTWATDWANDGVFGEGWNLFGAFIPGIPVLIEAALEAIGCASWLQGLILDGMVAGVGAVLGFVPQMLILFLFLAFLEACGYMARVAFIMDRIFRRFGLSGKSFIPMLIGSGCSVPGIMASRTIEQDKDRKMTIMTTSFVPCGAKLPIIALIAGAMFGGAWWVAPSAYFTGIAAIVCSGIVLKKTRMFAGDTAPFVMELPVYHMPAAMNVLRSMWERGWSFIKKAGTIILLSTIVLWFLMSFGWADGSFGMLSTDQLDSSILAALGGMLGPVFAPLGFGDWKMAVATVTGLIAKENVVGTFGVLFGVSEVAENGAEIWSALAGSMTGVAAYSFLIFNLLCAPCFAAMGAIKREMNDIHWFWFAIGYQTVLAYGVSLCVFQFGTLISGGAVGMGTIAAGIVTAMFVYLLMRRPGKEMSYQRPVKKAARVR